MDDLFLAVADTGNNLGYGAMAVIAALALVTGLALYSRFLVKR
ncbi:hypothetical protein [Methylovulum psychrotolerans]|nr:hypothetical protein [Methylovulum psychrotolerans]